MTIPSRCHFLECEPIPLSFFSDIFLYDKTHTYTESQKSFCKYPNYRPCNDVGWPTNLYYGDIFFLCLWHFVCQFSMKYFIRHELRNVSNKTFNFYCSKNGNFCLRHSWVHAWLNILFKIGIHSVKGIRKKSQFYKYECPPLPPPHCRVVLLYTEEFAERLLRTQCKFSTLSAKKSMLSQLFLQKIYIPFYIGN